MTATNRSTLVIVGAGGHGRVVADAALAQGTWPCIVATDADPAKCSGELLPGVQLIAFEQAKAMDDAVFHIAVGSCAARANETAALGVARLATVIHPMASVSPFADVQPGVFVAAQAVVAPGARVGVSVIVNHGAVVDHDAQVGDFTHLAPHAALGGAVRVGARVLMGTGSRILPGLAVADNVTLGAGAVVVAPISIAGVYAGVPARRIR